MATRQNDELGPSKIIGAISRLAGALVGTAVLTGRRIIKSTPPGGGSSTDKLKEKSARAPAKEKKKIAKRKGTRPAQKSGISKAKTAQAPAKRKKKAASKKKKKGPKAKKKLKTAKRKGANPLPKSKTPKK